MGLFKSQEKDISYLATYFPTSGRPIEIDVKADENGNINHDGKTWKITPTSSWVDKKGLRRIILPEGIATSFDGGTVSGKSILSARLFFLCVKNAVLEQIYKLQNQKPWFKQSSTWILAGAIAIVALLIGWVAVEIGGGFSDMKDVLEGWDFTGFNEPVSPSEGGHQPITQR